MPYLRTCVNRDRTENIKGIPQKLRTFDKFLKTFPGTRTLSDSLFCPHARTRSPYCFSLSVTNIRCFRLEGEGCAVPALPTKLRDVRHHAIP